MCHGVFDVVHPGHVRHLLYAKSKADILIASLTADSHISKGTLPAARPAGSARAEPRRLRDGRLRHHRQERHADREHLSSSSPTSSPRATNTRRAACRPKTQEEAAVIHAYGGEIIFTPGDIVYSSSKLIDLAPPAIRHEKLLSFMDAEKLTFDSLREALPQLGGRKVHVVGDTIVDSYTYGTMIGGQTKTPTMSVLFERRDDYVGGAAIVAEHLRAAGAEVVFSTVLGDDALKDFVFEGLAKSGIDCRAIIDQTRPTTNKNAIVSGGYRLLKVDTLDNRSISDDILGRLVEAIREVPCDAVVFSDFRHGIFNRRTIPNLIDAIPAGSMQGGRQPGREPLGQHH